MNIIYFHGFGSSGATKTAKRLRKLFPKDNVVSPDIPLNPIMAVIELKKLVQNYSPEDTVIVGTSMGGFYAQMMAGFPRILVNPSFHSSKIIEPDLNQTMNWFCKRQDGTTSFVITDKLVKDSKKVESEQFDNCDTESFIIGYFADEDELVHCKPEYLEHYSRYVDFHGGHRITDEFSNEYLFPLLRVLKEHIEGKEYFDLEKLKTFYFNDMKTEGNEYFIEYLSDLLTLAEFETVDKVLEFIDIDYLSDDDVLTILELSKKYIYRLKNFKKITDVFEF